MTTISTTTATTTTVQLLNSKDMSAMKNNSQEMTLKGAKKENGHDDDHSNWKIALYYYYYDNDEEGGNDEDEVDDDMNQENFEVKEKTKIQRQGHTLNGNKIEIQEQIELHTKLCTDLQLNGRIRISCEGLNGVLSGLSTSLRQYEKSITESLKDMKKKRRNDMKKNNQQQQRQQKNKVNDASQNDENYDDIGNGSSIIDDDSIIDLNVKYCHLRNDLSIESQLFQTLIVKETKTVISLFDQDFFVQQQGNNGKTKKKRSKQYNRRQRRKQRQQQQQQTNSSILEESNQHEGKLNGQQGQADTEINPGSGDNPTNNIDGDGNQMEESKKKSIECTTATTTTTITPPAGLVSKDCTSTLDMSQLQQQMMNIPPSRHLTTKEWNERLERAASIASSTTTTTSTVPSTSSSVVDATADNLLSPSPSSSKDSNKNADEENKTSNDNSTKNNALLLDVRNVYESRVGYFAVPNVPTLLTNTRKYSDLPNLLASHPSIHQSNEIFMYCTGGVRCERVSQLVQTLYPTKQVYQLQGGIQTYLRESLEEEEAGEAASATTENDIGIVKEEKMDRIDFTTRKVNSSNGQPENSDSATTMTTETKTNSSSHDKKCYFQGKNFVFDPRRTDPVYYKGPTLRMVNDATNSTAGDENDNEGKKKTAEEETSRYGDADGGNSNDDGGGIVGRCMICMKPHDDYDNGHAPVENKEARCNKCRMLILLCNDCRPNYLCWGEEEDDDDGDDDKEREENNDEEATTTTTTTTTSSSKENDDLMNKNMTKPITVRRRIYCGGISSCVHEGAAPQPEVVTFSSH